MITIERELFEAWLFNPAQSLERMFDYMDVNGECAICCFFKETYKVPEGGIEGGGASIRPYRSRKTLAEIPEWWDCGNRSRKTYDFTASLAHMSKSGNTLTIASMRLAYIARFGDPTALPELLVNAQ